MQISVIIPTYQPKDYIWQCLDSLDAQTLDKRLWEVIIVLNGCSDPWETEIGQYITNHHWMNARLIQTDEAGVSNARNIGLDQAKGEYITFIDDDDYVSPTYLEELKQIADKDTIAASYTVGFSDKQALLPYYIEKEYDCRATSGKQPFYKAKKYFGVPHMKLIHRDIIGEQRFDTRFQNGEDSLFMFAISPKMRYIHFTDMQAVYYRRFRPGSASIGQQRGKAFKNRLHLMHAYNRLYWGHPTQYLFRFYITRLIASLHAIIKGQ